jgi:hypothetical protein
LAYGGPDAGAVTILNGPRPLQGWILVAGTGTSRSTGTGATNVASWQDLGLVVGATGPAGPVGATGSAGLPPGYAGQVPVNIATGTATSLEYEAQNISIPGVSGTQDYVPVFTGNNTGTATATSSAITRSHLQQVSDGFNLYLPAPVLRMRSFAATSNTPAIALLGRSHSDTLGEFATTSSGDALGSLLFRGLSSTVSSAPGAVISATQDGAAGATYVPTKLCINTSSNAATFVDQLCVRSSGNCSCSGNFSAANIAGTPAPFMIPIADSLGTLDSWITTAGANVHLSNLVSPTAVNQHMLPLTSIAYNLGSPTQRWNYAYMNSVVVGSSITGGNITATPGNSVIPVSAASGAAYLNSWVSPATTGAAGLMSSADKTKLDGLIAGANTSLSNLTTTSINQHLVPQTAYDVNLGSVAKPWEYGYVDRVVLSTSITGGNITATPGASKIPVADASGNLNAWVTIPRIRTYWTNAYSSDTFTNYGTWASTASVTTSASAAMLFIQGQVTYAAADGAGVQVRIAMGAGALLGGTHQRHVHYCGGSGTCYGTMSVFGYYPQTSSNAITLQITSVGGEIVYVTAGSDPGYYNASIMVQEYY